jgi:hypothetical protein
LRLRDDLPRLLAGRSPASREAVAVSAADRKRRQRERERGPRELARACEALLPAPGEPYDAELAFSWLLPDLLANAPDRVLAAREELFLGGTGRAPA